jgi:cytochrome c biogenesis protein CcdA
MKGSIMDNLNQQLIHGIYLLLTSKPVSFILEHSLMLGIVSGIISLMPFAVKRILHVVILLVAGLALLFVMDRLGLKITEVFYSAKADFIATLVGNYLIGCIFGFSVANLIQRIRGEHDHVINN